MTGGARRAERPSRFRGRLRALLSLGVILPVGFTGTLAAWTDSAELTGTSITSGSIDLELNEQENVTSGTLSMVSMVPGNTSAEVFTLTNSGLSPLTWSVTGGLAGLNAADFNSAIPHGINLTVREGGSKSGAGSSSTCTGGTALLSDVSLTSTTSTSLLSGRGPLAAGEAKSLCVQITFSAAAASALQNKAVTATFSFTGTSDVS